MHCKSASFATYHECVQNAFCTFIVWMNLLYLYISSKNDYLYSMNEELLQVSTLIWIKLFGRTNYSNPESCKF